MICADGTDITLTGVTVPLADDAPADAGAISLGRTLCVASAQTLDPDAQMPDINDFGFEVAFTFDGAPHARQLRWIYFNNDVGGFKYVDGYDEYSNLDIADTTATTIPQTNMIPMWRDYDSFQCFTEDFRPITNF